MCDDWGNVPDEMRLTDEQRAAFEHTERARRIVEGPHGETLEERAKRLGYGAVPARDWVPDRRVETIHVADHDGVTPHMHDSAGAAHAFEEGHRLLHTHPSAPREERVATRSTVGTVDALAAVVRAARAIDNELRERGDHGVSRYLETKLREALRRYDDPRG